MTNSHLPQGIISLKEDTSSILITSSVHYHYTSATCGRIGHSANASGENILRNELTYKFEQATAAALFRVSCSQHVEGGYMQTLI